MANRNLLKEAIADAKSVKEAAIANAKAALEEAFTPYLKEKFSAKLAEMETEEGMYYEDDKEMEENYSESEVEEMDLDELLAELDEEMGKDEDMEENLNEDARTDAEEEGYEDGMEDEKEDEEEDEIDLEDMTEDELKDLIEDVIEDMVRAGELEAGEKFEDEDEEEDIDIDMEDEEEIVAERAYYGKNKGDKPRKSTAKEKDELLKEEEDMMDEGVIDQLKAVYNDPEFLGKLITVDGKKMSLKDFLAMAGSAAAGGMRKSGAGKGPFNTEGVEEDKRTDAEEEGYLDGMRDEKEDMMREIEELALTLSETKLLNAKLLYTNKIFRAKNLNETQKVKVLEAFDKATSVRDAKLIYETLTTVKETKTAVTESMRGMASKAAGMAPEKKPILEVNDQFARWQILAGIKRN